MSAFQIIFDSAASISINKKKKVSQTVSRDGTVKGTSLGGQNWTFELRMPDGPSWTSMRSVIEQMEALDRVTTSTIQISSPKLSWLNGYQGNLNTSTSLTVSFSTGTLLTITSPTPTLTSGYKLKSGDFIQLGTTGSVYTVVNDVPWNSNDITVHRPVKESTGTYTLVIGQNVSWNVVCTSFPQWTIFARDQVSWSGPFVFVEA